jgi:hypothetical protein
VGWILQLRAAVLRVGVGASMVICGGKVTIECQCIKTKSISF